MKVAIIGAGSVGATLAQRVMEGNLADVVLLDIVKAVACGKAMDISDAAPIMGYERIIVGTDDYEAIKSSDIVVITAGLPRKPGMSREELISKNASIVKEVTRNIKAYTDSPIIIVVTNPLDAMTYLVLKTGAFKKERVLGMAGLLDTSRFINLIALELKVLRSSVQTYILGSHGDTMVPLISRTYVYGKPISDVVKKGLLDKIVRRTRDRGAEIVGLLGSGSAYYSPSAAVFKMIKAILDDTRETLVLSAYLNGEYGLDDICIGVPCRLGRNGIEEIIQLDLSEDEKRLFHKSAKSIKSSIDLLRTHGDLTG